MSVRRILIYSSLTIQFLAQGIQGPALARGGSWITYRLEGAAEVFRIEAVAGAISENISSGLNSLTPAAADIWLNISPNGEWYLLETERWGCVGWACLARVKADFSEGALVTISGSVIHLEGFSAISSDGKTIVWTEAGCSTHTRDLWVSSFDGVDWSTASCLTASSAGDWNHEPAISADGAEVLFSCGENICSVDIDGNNLGVEVFLADHPGAGDWSQIHSPDHDPDGHIVFEGEAAGELIWRKNRSNGVFELINGAMSNDNSPCVLPDGRIASLWLNRPGNPSGFHELKVMDADGSNELMLVTTPNNVFDIGMGCGGTAGGIFFDGFESGDLDRWSATTP